MFDSLSQDEQDTIIDPKGIAKLPAKDTNKASISPARTDTEPKHPPHQPKRHQKKMKDDAENDAASFYIFRGVELG
jgi:hypothetical protein